LPESYSEAIRFLIIDGIRVIFRKNEKIIKIITNKLISVVNKQLKFYFPEYIQTEESNIKIE